MDTLLVDLRYALRALRRSPGFTLVAVLTLALGIGANSAIFSIVNAVLLQPLPYPAADRLALLAGARGKEIRLISIPDVDEWRARNRTFEDIGIQRSQSVNLTGAEAPERLTGSYVGANTMHLLGARTVLGRLFTPEETAPGSGQRVTLLSAATWRARFASDSGILGRMVTLDGRPHRVIGVVSDSYRDPFSAIDVFLPIASAPSAGWFQRDNPTVWAYGRVKPGVTIEQAQADLSRVARELAALYPASNAQAGASVRALREALVGPVKATLLTVLGFVAVVLLIACANVANLQLARAAVRAREISLRVALGAGRARLVRQLLTESLVIAVVGGAAGVVAASWGVPAIVALVPGGLPTFSQVGLDARVLAFSAVITVAAGLLFGLAPAVHAVRRGLSAALHQRDAGVERPRRLDPRSVLVAAQLASCIVLLIGAGLLTRSLRKLTQVDPGFDPAHVLTAEFRLPRTRYASDPAIVSFMTTALERIRAVPGVREAALVQSIPLSGNWNATDYVPDTRPGLAAGDRPEAQLNVVSDRAFGVLGIPVLEGRDFTAADVAGSPGVAIVSRELARRTWPGESALGHRLQIIGPPEMRVTVVGVVGDIRQRTLREPVAPQIYQPMTQAANIFNSIAVRTVGDPDAMAASVRAALWSVDRDQPVWRMRPFAAILERDLASSKFSMLLTSLFGVLALTLATIGVYGVTSFAVVQRTREMGIRLAIGARPAQVVRMILARGLAITAFASAVGLLAAAAGSRLLAGQLFGVAPVDPATYAVVTLILAAAAAVASWLPARRAARTDPMIALRSE